MTTSEDSSFDDSMFLREFVKHQPALRAYARALLPDWNAVDEAIQEASVVMWRKIDQLKSENDFLPWAKTVLRFEALKARRKFARDRHVFNDDALPCFPFQFSPRGRDKIGRKKFPIDPLNRCEPSFFGFAK